ncbi:hypothetical protein BOTBODRAFT_186312 [Botryobasidium botryosum FD-172 SS1]|uniref:RlpA-like protein double-psi beta-barrel domain-containing protein n=1 Tax=Botryobasidium botryosum (strain FD-172 SS1) TaxID=930990 RepID=A0A067MPK3_BOTB1|nr:hypothetical protein BOTBODRAFT_186312 [Botryobasidium botryosum FD-172 SS1]
MDDFFISLNHRSRTPFKMHLSALLFTALAATGAYACTQCPHPGTFTGNVGEYTSPSTNYCGVTVGPHDIVASLSASWWDPPDESPCGGTITVTLPKSGHAVSAIVVNKDSTLATDDIQLNDLGLDSLSSDNVVADGEGPVVWTFNP